MKKMKYSISDKRKEEIKEIIRKFFEEDERIIFAYIHGSFLYSNFGDIDIAVFVDEGKLSRKEALEHEIALALELEKIIKLPVDVKIINFAPLGFKYEVTKGEVIFSRDENKRYEFLEKTWQKYLDFKQVEKKFIIDML